MMILKGFYLLSAIFFVLLAVHVFLTSPEYPRIFNPDAAEAVCVAASVVAIIALAITLVIENPYAFAGCLFASIIVSQVETWRGRIMAFVFMMGAVIAITFF